MVVFLVSCIANSNIAVIGRCNSQLRRSRAGFHCNSMFILCYLAVGWKSKSTLFFVAKRCRRFVRGEL